MKLFWILTWIKSPCINISELTTDRYKTDQCDRHPWRQKETHSTISAFMPVIVTLNEGSCAGRKSEIFKVIDAQRQAESKIKKII